MIYLVFNFLFNHKYPLKSRFNHLFYIYNGIYVIWLKYFQLIKYDIIYFQLMRPC